MVTTRKCECGRELAKGKWYCDECREARRRLSREAHAAGRDYTARAVIPAWTELAREPYERGEDIAVIAATHGVSPASVHVYATRLCWDKAARKAALVWVHRPWAEAIRPMFESGAPMAEMVATGLATEPAILLGAKVLRWDWKARKDALRLRSQTHVEGGQARCVSCGELRPVKFFARYRGGGLRKQCKRCVKRDSRRRKGATPRSELARRGTERRRPTKQRALRAIRTLLGRLLAMRCVEQGRSVDAVEYQARYRNDPAFREKEIARTWARKAASGVLRTDARTTRIVHEDGTLTPDVVRHLFAAATHCPYCTEALHPRDKTLDHKHPVSRGGLHALSNVVVCCRSCNSRKGDTPWDVWLSRIDTVRREKQVA